MPLNLSLEAPGSLCRLVHGVAHPPSSCYPALPTVYLHQRRLLALATRPPCTRLHRYLSNRSATLWTCGGWKVCRHEALQIIRKNYFVRKSSHEDLPESPTAALISIPGASEGLDIETLPQDRPEDSEYHGQFCGQLGRRTRKSLRQSRPTQVLLSIQNSARKLYSIAPLGKIDLSYTSPRRVTAGRRRRRKYEAVPSRHDLARLPEPVSLYSILARYIEHHTLPEGTHVAFRYENSELGLLQSRGYSKGSVEIWAACLVESRSKVAAKIFEPGVEMPPFFLLLLFLRRKNLRALALGVIMRHVDHRVKLKSISWLSLKILVIRLLRHARELWPESIPWIASFLATKATQLHNHEGDLKPLSPQMHSDVIHFCNNLLLLLSLPGNNHPIVSASHQEKAQLQVLQYMASASPAILVTRLGFRSVMRNQLAHAKTDQERGWAELKGPSWPPWKENRTAMDEDKGYEFGASRASKILHRMYEAGYGGRIWEEMAETYAGWDTDYSPTIQTRTSLPEFSSQYRDEKHLRFLLWAGRIRTTRTRREAWACFLAHEVTGAPTHQEIYLAMFEKLYYPTVERLPSRGYQLETDEELEQSTPKLLPGDMREVLPDPTSPLHHVFLSEPIPTYKQLYHRMFTRCLRPSARLLAFFLETCPDFNMTLDILDTTKDDINSGIGHLVAGQHDHKSLVQEIPGYLFAAFIRFLCRFGHFDQPPPRKPDFVASKQHALRFKLDRQYLLEYAHALLTHYQPTYRPAWTAYADKMVQHKGSKLAGNVIRYRIICELIDTMEQVDIDVDDELFRLICTSTLYAVQTATQGSASIEDARYIFLTASRRLRTLFHSLVGANAAMQSPNPAHVNDNTVPPHIPGPAELHAYVRALGILRNYEGLYSFSTWLTKHHVEVTARAKAQYSGGSRLLFRMLVALRAAVDGRLEVGADQGLEGSAEIAPLIRAQIEGVEEWGGWPAQEYVEMYIKGHLNTPNPGVGGR